jgi:hypothetical protein
MYRTQFVQFLQGASANPSVNAITLQAVSLMNDQMARRGAPMSKDHFEVAHQSIARGDCLCDFLEAENKHVLESTGSGAVYQAGFLFHKTLVSGAIKIEEAVKSL